MGEGLKAGTAGGGVGIKVGAGVWVGVLGFECNRLATLSTTHPYVC